MVMIFWICCERSYPEKEFRTSYIEKLIFALYLEKDLEKEKK